MKKTLLKRFTSVTLATALIGTMGVAAFAEDANPTEGKTITISKQLNIAQGLEAPTTDFDFVFTKKTEDGNTTTTSAMPDLSGKVSYNKDTDTDADGYVIKNVTVDPTQKTWGHAGVYVYEVTETKGEVTGVTYDETSKYTVTIYVKNGTDGPEVDKIVVKDKDGKKVDVDTPDPTTKPEGDTDDLASGMKFENTYAKIADSTQTGRDENPDTTETEATASYVVTKKVQGDYSDKTKQFKFTMTVDTTKTNVTNPTITYYKLGADKTTVTPITPADGKVSFTLADGEKLVVEGAPVGTLYTVTENLANDDEAAKKYAAGTVVTEKGAVNTTKGTTLNVNDDTTWGKNVTVEKALVADGENSAAYTNENAKDDTTTPTGILINNAPYIILALVAAGGMTFYVVKKRKEN